MFAARRQSRIRQSAKLARRHSRRIDFRTAILHYRRNGGVFLGTTLYNAGQIARVLELPDKVIPVITLAIGVPASDAPQGPTERLPLRSVLHLDKYQPFDNNDIESLYATLEAAESSHKFVAENNKKTLAQVFTDVRYPRDSAEAFSNTLKEFIKIYL